MEGLRVAFAGHVRAEDLGNPDAVARQIRDAFGLLGAARGLLLTGLAEGADTLAVAAWIDLGLGEVHAVMPYLDTKPPSHLAPAVTRMTWLDGGAAEAGGRNAHLAQTRWLMEDAELLVVVWTGDGARGAGGTADAVRVALRRGMPVLWIKPGASDGPRIISPAALDTDFGFLEFLEQLRLERPPLVMPATAADIAPHRDAPTLSADLAPPPHGILAGLLEGVLDRTVWRTFAVYRRLVGGPPAPRHESIPIPESLWAEPGFEVLTEAYADFDVRATRLAAVHRSQQVFQALMMILAVAMGASPAVWPGIKIYAVVSELVLALVTFLVWMSAVRSERSRRWGEARRAAEQLRLERAAWALGLSTRDDRRFAAEGPAARLAWAWRRRAGAPDGRFDRERVAAWGAWALDDLLYGQIAYHHIQGHLNHRLAHRGHSIENTVFWLLVLLLSAFAVAYGVARHEHVALPHWFGGVVILAGAVTPAFGAASLALDASLAFSDQGRRSDALRRGLEAIARGFDRHTAGLDAFQRAARAAIRLQISQEDSWSDEAAHRHVVRGG